MKTASTAGSTAKIATVSVTIATVTVRTATESANREASAGTSATIEVKANTTNESAVRTGAIGERSESATGMGRVIGTERGIGTGSASLVAAGGTRGVLRRLRAVDLALMVGRAGKKIPVAGGRGVVVLRKNRRGRVRLGRSDDDASDRLVKCATFELEAHTPRTISYQHMFGLLLESSCASLDEVRQKIPNSVCSLLTAHMLTNMICLQCIRSLTLAVFLKRSLGLPNPCACAAHLRSDT